MYQRRNQIQELFVCLIDGICVGISFILAGFVRYRSFHVFNQEANISYILVCMILIHASSFYLSKIYENICVRGWLEEFIKILKYNLLFTFSITAVAFSIKNAFMLSRLTAGYTVIFCQITIYIAHQCYKYYMIHIYRNNMSSSKVMLVTVKDRLEDVLKGLDRPADWSYRVVAAAVMDEDLTGRSVRGIPVVAGRADFMDYVLREAIDEVFIHLPDIKNNDLKHVILELEKMGVVIHLNIDMFDFGLDDSRRIFRMGDYYTLVFSSRLFDYRKLLVKRFIDIAGAAVGLVITAAVAVFLAPVLLLESPGPLIFKQNRVGKNGRIFEIYKFRSMYADAEQHKAELMEQNEMQGNMFKVTDDPRVTKVGRFIRKTSIDELPQFWNVLKGNMSLVGTRPPTVEEFELYEGYQKRRLSISPGITGLWQISGRSDITDFEEVVRLDLEYIDNWSIWLDIKILLKTIVLVATGKGAK